MNTATTGAQIARDRIDRYRSFGAFGKPAWQSHVQLRAMLKAKLGERYANYFAKPTFDADAGELRWTAEVPGTARGWHEMTAEEQAGHALDMEDIRSRLIGYGAELRAQGGGQPGGAAAFASLLEQATKVPLDGNFLYLVGDQPVIAFWGFENQGGGSIDPTVMTPRFAPAAPAVPPPSGVPLAGAVAGTVVLQKKRPWWWWLLWLLLALLLLLLLLGLMRGCTPDGGFDAKRIVSGASPADDVASAARDGRGVETGPGGAAGAGGPGGAVDGGGAQSPDSQPGASQPGTGQTPEAAASMPGGDTPQDPKQDPPKPGDDPRKDTKDDPKKDPKEDPAKDPNKEPKANPNAKPDKSQTDPPKPGEDPKAMKLPKDPKAANKMEFLQGDWKAGEGLSDPNTKQPLDLSVQFGKDGKGEITLRRPDGTVCSGGVQGQMKGGKLAIEGNQSIPCAGGGSYAAPKIECSNSSGGQTDCHGINKDGSRYNMEMRRK